MQARIARMLAPVPKNTCELHHHGVLRLESQPDGGTSISTVRIVNRGIQKTSLHLTSEEFTALDDALRESFGRTETPGPQLSLNLPRERSEPEIPLPRGPSYVKPRRFRFARRGGKRG